MSTEYKRVKHAQRNTETNALANVKTRENRLATDTKRWVSKLEDGTPIREGGESVRYLERFGTLASALTAFGSTEIHAILASSLTLTANATIPATVFLDVSGAGTINLNGFNLTINGPFRAAWKRVFTGSGTVTFAKTSVKEVVPHWFDTLGTIAGDTSALQKAVATGRHVFIPAGSYQLNDHLLLQSSQIVTLTPDTVITQTAVNKNIFRIVQKEGVWIHCNGATLWGEGTYEGLTLQDGVTPNPDAWVGNSGHEDRAIQFLGCQNCGVTYPIVKNCGHSGIAIIGGKNIKLIAPHIEGTHTHGTLIFQEDNFQMGIFLQNNAAYTGLEAVADVQVISPRISGTAQGVVLEDNSYQNEGISFVSPIIHDVPGQHGFYLQSGGVTISNPIIHSMGLSGVKLQSGGNNPAVRSFVCTDFNIWDCPNSQAVEVAVTAAGSIADIKLSGVARNCSRGIALAGNVKRAMIHLVAENITQGALQIQDGDGGGGADDIEAWVKAKTCGRDAISVTATGGGRIRVHPTLEDSGTNTNNTYSAILVQSASINVDVFNPYIINGAANKPIYGIFNTNSGSTVGVYGTATITGYTTHAVRTANNLTAWPLYYTVGSTPFYDNATVINELALARAIMSSVDIRSTATIGLDTPSTTPTNRDLEWRTNAVDRWALRVTSEAESGSSAGSNLGLRAYDDAGALIDEPFTVNRASGDFVVNRPLRANVRDLIINGAAGTTRRLIVNSSGTARWILNFSSDAESGSDAGTNFSLNARADGGGSIDDPIHIVRATGGQFTIGRPLRVNTQFGLNVTPASAQTGAAQTAGAAYGATEQDMLQKAYDALRTFGFLA